MTSSEITVVGCGLVLGYWIVSALFNAKSTTSADSKVKAESSAQHEESRRDSPKEDAAGEETDNPASWFRILEVSEDASEQEITEAYKRKIRQYHPDKVAQMGAEIRQLAESKSKQINAAYDYAIRRRRRV
jgi:DnaJ like chaperone protein